MANEEAPEGQVYVCTACGKRSKDRYGGKAIDRGWDVSCAMNAVLVTETEAAVLHKRATQIDGRGTGQ